MVNSNQKGKRGERMASKAVSEALGITARRGQQRAGGQDSPDIVTSLPGVHFEVKFTEALSLYVAMAQAIRDCGNSVPVVLHKRKGKDWLFIVRLKDVKRLPSSILHQEIVREDDLA